MIVYDPFSPNIVLIFMYVCICVYASVCVSMTIGYIASKPKCLPQDEIQRILLVIWQELMVKNQLAISVT